MSVFAYPSQPWERRHGPQGYVDYQAFKPWLRDEFAFRCVFCLRRERWDPDGHAAFGVDHFIPQTIAPDRVYDYENLRYACVRCNAFKKEQIGLLDPCRVRMAEHLLVQDDGRIDGLTPEGRALVQKLQLDHPGLTEFRRRMLAVVRILEASPHPDAAEALRSYLGFPADLPDLRRLRPPAGNSRPAGVKDCYFVLRAIGRLPDRY